MKKLDTSERKNIVVLTGAGVSAASGLRTFRGPNGLWEEADVERLSHVEQLETDPNIAWKFFSELRTAMIAAQPNAAHYALAAWEQDLVSSQRKLTLITQNIDELHQRAGSKSVVEMHGNIFRTKCNNAQCPKSTPILDHSLHDVVPKCNACADILRPDIVLFGEMIPTESDHAIRRALRDCDLFMAIGTSGTVFPACDFVRSAKYAGANTILINPEPVPAQNVFDQYVCGRAEEVLPALLGG
jgi:NAD-dependent deacetylase